MGYHQADEQKEVRAGQELGNKQPGLLLSGYSSEQGDNREQKMSKLGKHKI